MPQVSYPGVYIVEKPSGVRTITGVATSVAAFVGFTRKGVPDKAVMITSFADFERQYGGLDRDSPVSYAVRQFFLNGGTQALIVRVAMGTATAAFTLLDGPDPVLDVVASSPGTWGNSLKLYVQHAPVRNPDADFNLVVRQVLPDGLTMVDLETHRNLTLDPNSPQFVESVVNNASAAIRVKRNSLVTFTKQGFALSGTIAFPLNLSDTTIGGTLDGNTPFLLTLGGAPWADMSELVTAANNAIAGQGLAARLANSGREFTGAGDRRPTVVGNLGPSPLGADGTKGVAGNLVGSEANKTGIYALLDVDLFNLLLIPETFDMSIDQAVAVVQPAVGLCEKRRAFYIVDAPSSRTLATIVGWANSASNSRNAATYFPAVRIADPLDALRPRSMAPSGTLAGVYARTDATRGVWKAPAGTDATLNGVLDVAVPVNDLENGQLNPERVNVLRSFPAYGRVAWGARTMKGSDAQADEYKYIPIRRLALFLEESLYRGTQWVVFEPNDEPLWAQIRLNIGAFMNGLFRQGAFQGTTPSEAFFVKCDSETTTQADRNLGIVNIIVGFAPLKPAEFVILTIQQIAGDLQ
jgi:phage tail sheath protein FI